MTAKRMRSLDGLRGVAVLLVVVGHISGTWAPYVSNVGVTIFFVLSGYLITSILIRERSEFGNIAFGPFYMRRFLRLSPALFVVLAITPALLAFAHDDRLGGYWFNGLVSALYLANFAEASDVSLGYFTHMWSLAVEEQFYLIWPLLLVLVMSAVAWGAHRSRTKLTIAIASLAAVAFAWRIAAMLIFEPDRVYYGLDTNAFMLLLGCTLATIPRETIRKVPGWVALVALVIIVAPAILIPTGSPIARNWLVSGAAILAVFAVSGAVSGVKLLNLKPLVWFGTISYGLYLWHAILLAIEWGGAEASGMWRVALAALSVGVAWMSFILVERPIQSRFKKRWERHQPAPDSAAPVPANAAGHDFTNRKR